MTRPLERMIRRMTEPNAQFRAYAQDLLVDAYWTEVQEKESASIPVLPTLQARPNVLKEKKNIGERLDDKGNAPALFVPRATGFEMEGILDVLKRHDANEPASAFSTPSPAPKPSRAKAEARKAANDVSPVKGPSKGVSPSKKMVPKHAKTASKTRVPVIADKENSYVSTSSTSEKKGHARSQSSISMKERDCK